ncbi:MAG: glycosyltransferase [Burkholderiales bacterium]|nr:glycosyltransferase [Burkholderiales bacterium]
MSKTCFFTIVSNNYRHFARSLVASVRAHDPDIDAYVAICDEPLVAPDSRDAFTEIPIRELGLPQFDRFTFQYTILELNTAIKPWVFAALFARGYERVIYLDPDIKVYGRLDPILARLDAAQIVLTPHLTGQLDDGRKPTELQILQSGSYNLGFVALRRTEETRRFVAWWQGKLERDCVVDIPRGLFTDQKWIDLVPGMYPGVAIERDSGWNVAYWNLKHRVLTTDDDGRIRVDGQPLLFFHFSGFTPGARLFSKHQDRYTIDDVPPAVRALADGYAQDLARNGLDECRQLAYAFGRLPSGVAIPDLVRRCYREDFPWDEPHPDLWTAEGERFVVDWLNRPAPAQGRSPWLTRLALALYRTRPDLQAAFPDVGGKHGKSYAHWFVEQSAAQALLPELFTAPVRAALEGRRGGQAAAFEPRDASAAGIPAAHADALDAEDKGPRRGAYRVAYRIAWGIRGMVKPLTTQAFRHRVRHALLRRAYFDDDYETPPLVTPAGSTTGAAGPPVVKFPVHVRRHGAIANPDDEGVNVVGYLAAESGIGESARSMLRIIHAAGVPVAPINFRVGNMSRMRESIPGVAATEHLHAINLFHINADQMYVARDSLGESLFEGRYNIGFWAWELRDFPDAWLPAFDLVDEVWVPSSFCQQAIAVKSPVPVLRVPHSVTAPPPAPDRARFGIAAGDVAFFAMCDILSVPERKNPLGVAEAFARAFPGSEAVRLFLKIGNLEFQPDLKSRLGELARADSRITLLEGYLARSDLWALMASIDCFVSLHRAEGFGLGMAEAMACGKMVIATPWSGNVDFTRVENALLVDYTLVELQRDLGPYRRGQVWAEPDLTSAADAMRKVAQSAELRARLGARGLATVAAELSPEALAPLVATRLRALHAARARGQP